MKNLFKTMMLVAVAAMGFTACSNNDVEEVLAPSKQTKKITVVSEITRTEFNSDLTKLVWSKGDTFAVFTDVETDLNIQSSAYAADATDFGLEVDKTATKVYAYYPYYAGNSSKTATEMSVGIPGTQTQSIAGQLTKGNLPMVAQGTIEGDKVALSFHPIATVLGFNIYGDTELTEKIVSIKFTASGEEKSSGYDYTYNLTDSEEVFTPGYQYTTLNLDGVAQFVPGATKAEKPQAYMVVNKIAYSAGVEIVVTTEGGTTYTFTSTQPIDCTETYRTMNLNLSKAEKVVPEKVTIEEGDYYILAIRTSGNFWAATSDLGTASTKRYQAVDAGSTEIDNVNLTNATVWTIEAVGDGKYYLKAGEQYAVWESGNSGTFNKTADETFTIDKNNDDTYNIHFAASDEERYFALNNDARYNYFAFYKNGQKQDLYLVPADGSGNEGGNEGGEDPVDPTPDPSGNVYTKVTSTADLTDGTYIIVYEKDTDAYVFNGQDAVNGYTSATISGTTITAETAFAGEVTIAAMTGGYSLKAASGYMYGTKGDNELNFNTTSPQANTITITNGTAKIVSNTSIFQFNASSNQLRFRYYKSENQKAVALYKKN